MWDRARSLGLLEAQQKLSTGLGRISAGKRKEEDEEEGGQEEEDEGQEEDEEEEKRWRRLYILILDSMTNQISSYQE